MKKLNFFFALIAIILAGFSFFKNEDSISLHSFGDLFSNETQPFGLDSLDKKVKKLLRTPYSQPTQVKIPSLDGINYEDYRQIVYKPEIAIWKNLGLPFQLQFFHPGHIYSSGVRIYELVDNEPTEIKYDASRFDFGNLKLPDHFASLSKGLLYTGFRIHFPLNNSNSLEEFAVFQGASYFRVISEGQIYGLSARGLAINTGLSEKEEFPVFEEFYIKRPEKFDQNIEVFALLNSESAVGSYHLTFLPGKISEVKVRSKVYLRKKVKRLGYAPLTSMFLYGETDIPINRNIHPEVHDSDGLLLLTEKDVWEWRPLINPKKTTVTKIPGNSLKGYGLIQRDRKFKSYQDDKMKYHLRPSAWIIPETNWGNGNLHLLEWATQLDSDDNMGVFWEPETHPNPLEPFFINYSIFFTDRSPEEHKLAKVSAVFRGQDPLFPNVTTLTLYFTGDDIKKLDKNNPPKPIITTNRKKNLDIHYTLEKISEMSQWRLIIQYPKEEASFESPLEWKVHLEKDAQTISETWIYQDGLSR